jgi:hypothetical protein
MLASYLLMERYSIIAKALTRRRNGGNSPYRELQLEWAFLFMAAAMVG